MIDRLLDLGDKIFSHVQNRRWAYKDSTQLDNRDFCIDRYVNVREIKNYRVCLCTANKNVERGKNKAHTQPFDANNNLQTSVYTCLFPILSKL